jgi:hypothetical protein
MKIRYRRDHKHPQHNMDVIATIVNISEFDQRLTIERDRGTQRKTTLSHRVWSKEWEPLPIEVCSQITEEEIRRIVRDELAAFARKAESAARSFLVDLFDAL